jgi:hypothetical protein
MSRFKTWPQSFVRTIPFTRLVNNEELTPWPFPLIWLVFRLEHILEGTLFYGWLLTLIAMDTVSLLVDIVDLVRYLRGDRTPRF